MSGNAPIQRVKQLATLVQDHMTFTRDHRDAYQSAGEVQGSPLASERALSATLPWGSAGVDTALSVASLKLMIAAWDHLGSIAMLLQPEGMTLFGHTVLARAAVEAAGRAYWILEPGISPRRRIARSMTERIASAEEAVRTEKGIGHALGHQRVVDNILADATSYGLQRRTDRKGRPLDAFDEHRPSATDIADQVLSALSSRGRGLYAYMSAFVHTADYAVLQHLEDAGPGDDDQHRSVEPVLSSESVGVAVTVAISAHAAAFDRYVTLHGWPRDQWERWWDTARRTLMRPDLLP